MGELIDMHLHEVKRQVNRHEYAVDTDAVAAAILRRLSARRAGTELSVPADLRGLAGAGPVAPAGS